MHTEKTVNNLHLSTNSSKLQFEVIYQFLSKSYWSEGISKSRMIRAIENSINIGVYQEGNQVAYARLITDKATFAYLCDVFVLESHRGQGISKQMMQFMHELPELSGLKRIVLATKDAHGLYSQYQFKSLAQPDLYMEINRSGIYKTLLED